MTHFRYGTVTVVTQTLKFGDLDAGLEVPSTYDWSDRYRPRKPRFFNRVHTGYEWSKYNQTHYE